MLAGSEAADPLRDTIATQDPAGFVRGTLNGIVESRREGPEFDQLSKVLTELREGRKEDAKTAKRSAVDVAKRILAREIDVIEGARQLQWIEREFQSDVFGIFSRITRKTRDHPVAAVRKHWATDALARVDRERTELEENSRLEVELASQKLIDVWAAI